MDEVMKVRVDDYLELLQEIRKEVDSEETAARLVSEIAKDMRMQQISEERQQNGTPATEKQKAFLDRLGVEYSDDVSKRKASKLIDEELAKNGQ